MDQDESQIHFNENTKQSKRDVEMDSNLEEVQVEFLFSEMRENYFHNIKTFVNALLDFDVFNTSEISDVIINQVEVGNIIKVGLEDDNESEITVYNNPNVEVYGVFTILNMNYYKNKSFVTKIKEFVLSKAKANCKNEDEVKKINQMLENSKLGLIVNERAINLPVELIPPLLNLTLQDIEKFKQENKNDSKYDFDILLNISKFVICEQRKTEKKPKLDKKSEDIVYYKFEDEEIINKSIVNFSYKIPYAQKDLEILENKNEPQYKNIAFIMYKDLIDINKLLNFTNI